MLNSIDFSCAPAGARKQNGNLNGLARFEDGASHTEEARLTQSRFGRAFNDSAQSGGSTCQAGGSLPVS